jgi:FSR family fosmidomycin resistance protein-like MFS transporter
MAAVATAAAGGLPEADRRGIGLLSIAHVFNDTNQSALPAIIPWLVGHHGLTLASAATLVLAMNLSSSVVQPLFGHLSDRRSLAWVIPLALLLAASGTAIIGFSTSMPFMLFGALISGIGVAAFHPEGSRFANYFAGANRATGMSWFTTGGYMGFALGPILVTPLLIAFGLHGVAWLLLPAAVMAILVWRDLPRFHEARARVHRVHRLRAGEDDWRGFLTLAGVVAIRSITFFAAVTFLPFFAIAVTHVSKVDGSAVLATMLVAGAFGTLWAGRLADRFDRRYVITISLFASMLFALAIAGLGFAGANFAALVPVAASLGFALGSSAGVLVVLGQEYLPQRIGVASGVTLGLAVTIGGLAAPLFGYIGDHDGLIAVFAAIFACGLVAALASLALPKPSGVERA